jgi:hypothetical protein
MDNPGLSSARPQVRFSLADLFRFVTVVAVLLGCAPLTGLPAAALLAVMALALAARQGMCAVFLYLAALVGANAMNPQEAPIELGFTFCLGLMVLSWYRWERFWKDGGHFGE